MGLENLTRKGQRPKSHTIKNMKVPPELVVKIREITKALKRDFDTTLLELADEGTKAYYLYAAKNPAKSDGPTEDGLR